MVKVSREEPEHCGSCHVFTLALMLRLEDLPLIEEPARDLPPAL